MRVELPRDGWAEYKDLEALTAGDYKATLRATRFEIADGGLKEISMGVQADQMDALLAQLITSWSLADFPLPRLDVHVLDLIPLDVYELLCAAAQPYKEAVDALGKSFQPNATPSPGTLPPETSPTFRPGWGRDS